MKHAEAVANGAVERYLLGQLSASESEEFEQHFFDCLECVQELRAGAMFEENAKSVFLEEQPQAEPGRKELRGPKKERTSVWERFWLRPWNAVPALAALALALVTAYQTGVVIPRLRNQVSVVMEPQAIQSHVLAPISRGDARVLEVPKTSRFYTVYMDPTWEGSFTRYLCSVQDESGSTKFSLRLPAPPPGEPLQILMTRDLLPSGRYTVVVRNLNENGKPETELARYALVLKLD
jgi:hypothetical protein